MNDPVDLLKRMFLATVAAAQPANVLAQALAGRRTGPLVVVGAGKAAAAMAGALEAIWEGPVSGLVATRYGHSFPCKHIAIIEAGHPIPDANSIRAGDRILRLLADLGPADSAVCFLSGGGSATMWSLPDGVSLDDVQTINASLLASGADIHAMNCVRRHLCQIKGGRLAVACHPARLRTIAISDVPGDALADIASGPSVPDVTTCADALAILRRHGVWCPPRVIEALERGTLESIKPDHPAFAHLDATCAMTPHRALEAARLVAAEAGVATLMLGDRIEGEARDVAKVMAGICRSIRSHGQPLEPPCIVLSGGETTVTVRGTGHGGRNVEFLLALHAAIGRDGGVYAVAADTDGVDGSQRSRVPLSIPTRRRKPTR